MNVSYNMIHKRRMALSESSDDYVLENCRLYLNRYKSTADESSLIKFAEECSKTTESSNKYSSILFEYADKLVDNKELKQIIIDKIAPRLTNYVNIPYYVNEQVQLNKICDRIWNNHLKITKDNNIVESFDTLSTNDIALVEKLCSVVDKFKLNSVGKIAVSLEEANLLYEMNGIEYDKKKLTRDITSFFMIRRNVNIDKINEAADNYNATLSDYIPYLQKELDSIEVFKAGKIKDINTLNLCIEDMLSGSVNTGRYILGLQKVLKLFEDIIIASEDEDFVNNMINYSTQNIYDIFYKEYKDANDIKTGIGFVLSILDSYIDKYNYMYQDIDDNIKNRFYALREKLSDIKGQFKELNDIIYPEYNASVLAKVSEGVTVNTIYADPNKNPGYWLMPLTAKAMGILDTNKDGEVDSKEIQKAKDVLKDKADKIEKSIDKKMANKSNGKGNIISRIAKIKNKLFKEESIFEFVNINTHRMDTLVTVYEVEGGVDAEIMNEFDSILKEINTYELNDSGLQTYFINRGSILEVRVATDLKVKLSESEIEESAKYISPLDMYLMNELMTYTESDLSPINNDDLSDLLVENFDHEEEILELAKYCGIDGSFIYDIDTEGLTLKEQTLLKEYKNIDISDETILESWAIMNELIHEAKDDNKDKEKKPINIDFDKVKLYLQGLKSKAKDLGTKEREVMRQIDSAANHFCDAVKRALSADNREQVIKGSVIPSFSKCIKIAIVAAGVFGVSSAAGLTIAPFTPIIVIFGALAGSKMLMAEEQRALVDELEVELEVLDKEIANCESENKPKKLRALLTTKKQLQRQYQRLKFGAKLSKNFKTSSVGVPKRD